MVVYTLYAVYFCVMKPSSHTPVQYKRQRETVRDRERDSERQRERHRETERDRERKLETERDREISLIS